MAMVACWGVLSVVRFGERGTEKRRKREQGRTVVALPLFPSASVWVKKLLHTSTAFIGLKPKTEDGEIQMADKLRSQPGWWYIC